MLSQFWLQAIMSLLSWIFWCLNGLKRVELAFWYNILVVNENHGQVQFNSNSLSPNCLQKHAEITCNNIRHRSSPRHVHCEHTHTHTALEPSAHATRRPFWNSTTAPSTAPWQKQVENVLWKTPSSPLHAVWGWNTVVYSEDTPEDGLISHKTTSCR